MVALDCRDDIRFPRRPARQCLGCFSADICHISSGKGREFTAGNIDHVRGRIGQDKGCLWELFCRPENQVSCSAPRIKPEEGLWEERFDKPEDMGMDFIIEGDGLPHSEVIEFRLREERSVSGAAGGF